MTNTRRRAIAKVAASRNMTIVEDDVYGLLIEDAPKPICHFLPEQTVLVSSLAKTLSVGIRLAFVRVPARFRDTMIDKLRASSFFPAPLLCEVVTNWIADGTADSLLQEQRDVGSRRRKIATDVFGKQAITFETSGNHLWMDLPDAWSAETLQRAAKENGVNVFTAASFAVPGSKVPNSIRIALGAARNDSELKIGLNVIARLLAQGKTQAATY